jgi:hypothetical protein
MKTFSVDGRGIRSFDDFIEAMNLGFIRPVGGEWNGNLDAFNDYLSWPEESDYQLEIIGGRNCSEQLGHAAQAEWLRVHVGRCHPSNVPDMQSRLVRANAGEGETLFDVLRKIIADHPRVRLILP